MEAKMKLMSCCVPLMVISLSLAFGQYTGCDYYQQVVTGESYAIYSPNYDQLYQANTHCRWTLSTTPGSRIALSCPDVYIPQSTSCYYDKLLISTGGKLDLSDSKAYCGTGTVTTESIGSSMVVTLEVSTATHGGRFYCTAKKINCQCGMKRKKKIVGGTETLVNEFPMMAALIDMASGNGIFCGATIISNFHAISAAHCPIGHSITNLALLVGDHNITSGTDTLYAAIHRVASIKTHELYNMETKLNDIAIVRAATEIIFSAGVGPACLPFKYYGATFVGLELEAVGWGSTDFGDPKSNVLLKVSLTVIDPSKCYATFKNYAITQICTFVPGKDTCQSDSGGPLLYTDFYNGLVYLIGTVSYGMACATNDPSVSTRVTEYMDWIMKNTPEWTYCYQ
ncbi:venom serine protease 34-like isoform X2 [Malaya genurostris]|uniref:venom serine protease 34-like isoform X2 n=1 Tax=Malaya genurostris TaxID=325434 RepID=UPI0026F3939B|nr:venom serine protease 34-like isoform X2 [Malaya genurostris]